MEIYLKCKTKVLLGNWTFIIFVGLIEVFFLYPFQLSVFWLFVENWSNPVGKDTDLLEIYLVHFYIFTLTALYFLVLLCCWPMLVV